MEYLIVPGSIISLLLAILSLSKKKKHVYDTILASYLFIIALHLFFYYLEYVNARNNYRYPAIILTSCPFALLHGPYQYFYTKSFFHKSRLTIIEKLLHLIPFIIMVITLTITVYIIPEVEKIAIIQSEIFTQWMSYKLIILMIIASSVIYSAMNIRLLNKHRKQISSRHSYIKNLELKWLRIFIIGMFLLVITIVITQILKLSIASITFQKQMNIIFTLLAIFAIYIGYFGIKETHIFTNVHFVQSELQVVPFQKTNTDAKIYNELIKTIRDKKLYQYPELTILKLSDEVNIPVNRLSKIIHTYSGKNFFDFINHFRIEHFKISCIEIATNPNFSISSLAYDSGFNSKTTFNRAFKKIEDKTPSQYIDS